MQYKRVIDKSGRITTIFLPQNEAEYRVATEMTTNHNLQKSQNMLMFLKKLKTPKVEPMMDIEIELE